MGLGVMGTWKYSASYNSCQGTPNPAFVNPSTFTKAGKVRLSTHEISSTLPVCLNGVDERPYLSRVSIGFERLMAFWLK